MGRSILIKLNLGVRKPAAAEEEDESMPALG